MASPAPVYPPPRARRSIAGPVVLILIGLLFLLRNLGVRIPLFYMFAHYWPVLLILWGLIKLWEYEIARKSGARAAGIGFGGGLLLFLLIIFGLSMTGIDRARNNINWGELRDEVQVDNGFMHLFGTDHQYDDQLQQDFPAGSSLKVLCDRGSVTINSWDQNQVKVLAHKRIFTSNDRDADNLNAKTKPVFTTVGNVVQLNANTQGGGDAGVRTDLEIYLPLKAMVDITTRRGDVIVNSRDGEVRVSNQRGDINAENVQGDLNVTVERGSIRASKIQGNINIQGRANDVVLLDVSGLATLNGDFFGDMRLSNLARGLRLHTSRTDLEFTQLDGDLDLDSGNLTAKQVSGPFTLNTRAKDIELQAVTGDVRITDDHGDVNVYGAPKIGNVEVNDSHGTIMVAMPPKTSFQFTGSTRDGDIQSDFKEITVSTSEHGRSTASGTVGKGGPRVQLTSETGDLEIRRGQPPAPPEPPPVPPAPKAPSK